MWLWGFPRVLEVCCLVGFFVVLVWVWGVLCGLGLGCCLLEFGGLVWDYLVLEGGLFFGVFVGGELGFLFFFFGWFWLVFYHISIEMLEMELWTVQLSCCSPQQPVRETCGGTFGFRHLPFGFNHPSYSKQALYLLC